MPVLADRHEGGQRETASSTTTRQHESQWQYRQKPQYEGGRGKEGRDSVQHAHGWPAMAEVRKVLLRWARSRIQEGKSRKVREKENRQIQQAQQSQQNTKNQGCFIKYSIHGWDCRTDRYMGQDEHAVQIDQGGKGGVAEGGACIGAGPDRRRRSSKAGKWRYVLRIIPKVLAARIRGLDRGAHPILTDRT